jgi:bifunctional enzyme CysN/CysC
MTGVSDPYEPPDSPELRLVTVDRSVDENVAMIVDYLEGRGIV